MESKPIIVEPVKCHNWYFWLCHSCSFSRSFYLALVSQSYLYSSLIKAKGTGFKFPFLDAVKMQNRASFFSFPTAIRLHRMRQRLRQERLPEQARQAPLVDISDDVIEFNDDAGRVEERR